MNVARSSFVFSAQRATGKVGDLNSKSAGTLSKLIIALAMFLGFAAVAGAHDVSQSESRIEVQGSEVRVVLKLNLLELGYVDTNEDNRISYDELDGSIERIYDSIKQHYLLRTPDLPTRITLKGYQLIEEHLLEMDLVYEFQQRVKQIEVTSTLYQITRPDDQHLISVTLDGDVHEGVADAENPTALFKSTGGSSVQTFFAFVRLGIMHIFTGYDHLAFLVGLLIVTTNLRSLIKIITSFTVAHSITLALATFNIVVLPSRLTESMIPLTIAYVAMENLLRRRAVERYYITFVFGLIHGFGFSNVLREMALSRSHLALSLFSFNLGVEIGQLTFVLVLFPLVIYMSSSGRQQQYRSAVSLAVMCLAVYWFVRRAFLI